MKKILGISVVMLLIIGVSVIVLTGLGMIRLPGFLNQEEIPITDLPKDVPIINGKIVSTKPFRSDELKRGIEIVVETNLSLPEVAKYYSDEFAKRDIRAFGLPTFQGNSRALENSTEASGGGETKSHQQVMVYLQMEPPLTLVRINVLGNSILSLPE